MFYAAGFGRLAIANWNFVTVDALANRFAGCLANRSRAVRTYTFLLLALSSVMRARARASAAGLARSEVNVGS
jgi:hypothetical protein